jgi:hypothetical protein
MTGRTVAGANPRSVFVTGRRAAVRRVPIGRIVISSPFGQHLCSPFEATTGLR